MNAPEWPRLHRAGSAREYRRCPVLPELAAAASLAAGPVARAPGAASDSRGAPAWGPLTSGCTAGRPCRSRAASWTAWTTPVSVAEAVADLRLRHRAAQPARADDHESGHLAHPHPLGDPRVAGDPVRPGDEDRHARVAGERSDGRSRQAGRRPRPGATISSTTVSPLCQAAITGRGRPRAGDQRVGRRRALGGATPGAGAPRRCARPGGSACLQPLTVTSPAGVLQLGARGGRARAAAAASCAAAAARASRRRRAAERRAGRAGPSGCC